MSIRSRKRSTTARVALLGAAAFGLASCQSEPDQTVEAQVFPSVEECKAVADLPENEFTAQDCEAGFEEALAAHRESAPRYDSQALCEEEHGGAGACQVEQGPNGSSIFLPLIAGMLIGNMLGGGIGRRAQPLYRTPGGRFATPGGGTVLSGNRGQTNVRRSSFATSPTTRGAAPLTRSQVQNRGGFGAARTSSGGARGFGG